MLPPAPTGLSLEVGQLGGPEGLNRRQELQDWF